MKKIFKRITVEYQMFDMDLRSQYLLWINILIDNGWIDGIFFMVDFYSTTLSGLKIFFVVVFDPSRKLHIILLTEFNLTSLSALSSSTKQAIILALECV